MKGVKYTKALDLTNRENVLLHKMFKIDGKYEIQEIVPIKFGESPISPRNEMMIDAATHKKLTTFWNRLQWHLERDRFDE